MVGFLTQAVRVATKHDEHTGDAFWKLGVGVVLGIVCVLSIVGCRVLGLGSRMERKVDVNALLTSAGTWQVGVTVATILIFLISQWITIPGYFVIFAVGTGLNAMVHIKGVKCRYVRDLPTNSAQQRRLR